MSAPVPYSPSAELFAYLRHYFGGEGLQRHGDALAGSRGRSDRYLSYSPLDYAHDFSGNFFYRSGKRGVSYEIIWRLFGQNLQFLSVVGVA